MAPDAADAAVVYGMVTGARGQISLLTRPMPSILRQLVIQVDMPAADIADGETTSSFGKVGIEHSPVIVVHSGPKVPRDAFVAIKYHESSFSISGNDFDSKVAFSVVQIRSR